MPRDIVNLYKKAGVTPPKGGRKGKHKTKRAHKAVLRYMGKGLSKNEAWKRVVGGMGKHAFKK